MEIKEILKDLIRINSECTRSNIEIINYIKEKLKKFEINEFRFKKEDILLANLVVKIPGKKSDFPLVFVGHVDTVPESPSWTKNPFDPVEKDGRIYGLGASDMKAGLSSIISAALKLNETPPHDVYLIFDADEEGNLTGGKQVLKDFSLKNARIIVAEPTDCKIVYAQKGCLDAQIIFSGKSMHSSKADYKYNQENNAIYKATRFCNEIMKYGKDIEKTKDKLFGNPTINIGKIEGGTAANVVADKCFVNISRRIVSSESIQDVFDSIVSIARKIDEYCTVNSLFWGDSFETNPEGRFLQKIMKSHNISELKINHSWTEAALFSIWGEVIIFGPGESKECHIADESVNVKNLYFFEKIYGDIMKTE